MVGANAGGKIVVDTIAGTDRGQTESVISSNLHCISLLEKKQVLTNSHRSQAHPSFHGSEL